MQIVLRNENGPTVAGYVYSPYDAGGETVCGICRRNYPQLMVWNSLDHRENWQKKKYQPTPAEMAEIYAIYRKCYYEPLRIDSITDAELALQVFDCAVNCGTKRAAKMLQKVAGVTQDGIIGPVTLARVNASALLEAYRSERAAYYRYIATKGSNARFLQGWLNRIKNTHL